MRKKLIPPKRIFLWVDSNTVEIYWVQRWENVWFKPKNQCFSWSKKGAFSRVGRPNYWILGAKPNNWSNNWVPVIGHLLGCPTPFIGLSGANKKNQQLGSILGYPTIGFVLTLPSGRLIMSTEKWSKRQHLTEKNQQYSLLGSVLDEGGWDRLQKSFATVHFAACFGSSSALTQTPWAAGRRTFTTSFCSLSAKSCCWQSLLG